jgi:hypothetical protein
MRFAQHGQATFREISKSPGDGEIGWGNTASPPFSGLLGRRDNFATRLDLGGQVEYQH